MLVILRSSLQQMQAEKITLVFYLKLALIYIPRSLPLLNALPRKVATMFGVMCWLELGIALSYCPTISNTYENIGSMITAGVKRISRFFLRFLTSTSSRPASFRPTHHILHKMKLV